MLASGLLILFQMMSVLEQFANNQVAEHYIMAVPDPSPEAGALAPEKRVVEGTDVIRAPDDPSGFRKLGDTYPWRLGIKK